MPFVGREPGQRDARGDAAGRLRRWFHHADAAAQHASLLTAELAQVARLHEVAELEAQRVAQRGYRCRRRSRYLRGSGIDRRRKAHCQRRLGRFGERRGQVDREADEVAGDVQVGLAAHETQVHAVACLAAQRTRGARELAELGGAAQAVGADRAGAVEAQRAIRLRAAVEHGVTAVHLRARADDRETFFGEVDAAFRVGQQRAAGADAHIVAGERNAASYAGGLDLVQRDRQVELQVGRAGRGARVERFVDPAADRRGADEAQHLGQRSAAGAVEREHRLGVEVADRDLHFRELDAADLRSAVAQLERAVVEQQVDVGLGERRPRRGVVRRGRHECETGVLDLRADSKFAVLRGELAALRPGLAAEERKVPEVATDTEVRTRDAAALDRVFEVLARALGQAHRQVAVGARRNAIRELGVEFEPTRKAPVARDAAARAGVPQRGQLAARIGVGKARVFDLHGELRRPRCGARRGTRSGARTDRLRLDLPQQLSIELVEHQQRIVEHAGQVDRAAVDDDARAAAGFGRRQLHGRAAQAGPAHAMRFGRRPRGERQA